jgi:hypothetical protein
LAKLTKKLGPLMFRRATEPGYKLVGWRDMSCEAGSREDGEGGEGGSAKSCFIWPSSFLYVIILKRCVLLYRLKKNRRLPINRRIRWNKRPPWLPVIRLNGAMLK